MFYVYYDFQQQINYQSPTIVPATTTSFTQLLPASSPAESSVQSYGEQQLFQPQPTIQQQQQQQQQQTFALNPIQLHQQQQPLQLKVSFCFVLRSTNFHSVFLSLEGEHLNTMLMLHLIWFQCIFTM